MKTVLVKLIKTHSAIKNGRQKYDFEFFLTTANTDFTRLPNSSKVINSNTARLV